MVREHTEQLLAQGLRFQELPIIQGGIQTYPNTQGTSQHRAADLQFNLCVLQVLPASAECVLKETAFHEDAWKKQLNTWSCGQGRALLAY